MKEYNVEENCDLAQKRLLECHTAVCILPIVENGDILLISKLKDLSNQWDLKLPYGDVQYKEQPQEAALRVLLGETGMYTNKIEPIGIYNSKGSIINVVYLFSATNLTDIKKNFTLVKDTHIITLSPNRFSELIREGIFNQEAGIKAFTKFYLSAR
ncbi:MAG: NUDIX domain-containing protein [Clostridiales bacterium]|nr:NUDIX domain-containing protein [Clostridiales bacterium]